MKLAINTTFINKADKSQFAEIVKTFQNVDVSRQELATLIRAGYSFCAQHKNHYKKSANFTNSDYLAVDIDHGMSLQDALDNEFVKNHAAILYTTVNHSDDFPRFRIVFETARTITTAEEMKFALQGLIKKFGGDKSCNDACRMFYGCKGSDPIVLDGVLPDTALDELMALGKETKTNTISDSVSGCSKTTTIRSNIQISPDTVVFDGNGQSHRLADLKERTSIHCPIHADNNASAFVVKSAQGVLGVHCSTCQTTYFTSANMPIYDFDYGLSCLSSLEEVEVEITDDNEYLTYTDCSVKRLRERYLPTIETEAPIVFVRSPKGTGKTEWLVSIVKEMKTRYKGDEPWIAEKQQWERRGKYPVDEYRDWRKYYNVWKKRAKKKSILLIGHRRSLIASVAQRLGLVSYIEYRDIGANGKVVDKVYYQNPTQYYAISVDSLSQRLNPKIHKYDYILIDEVEQVFAHLTSDTLKGKRNNTYQILKHYIDVAEKSYVMDADLNYLTVNTIANFVSDSDKRDTAFIINEAVRESRNINLYGSEEHLIAELMDSIENHERCFVCTNSKKQVDKLTHYIQSKYGESKNVLGITSANSQQSGIQDIIQNINQRILDYDVMIVSPSVGTGVDITFKGNAQLIDTVYGIFHARVNTHFDIDQQLSRVRNPKNIKVWITPEIFRFETDPEIIKKEIIHTSRQSMEISHIDPDGTIHLIDNDEYLGLYARVNSIRRGSINHLKQQFINLKEYNGWNIVPVDMDIQGVKKGAEIKRITKEMKEQEWIRNILSASIISKEEYLLLTRAKDLYTLTDAQQFAMRRYEIESFYYADATKEIITEDRDGKQRYETREYENYISEDSKLIQQDKMDEEIFHLHITDRKFYRARKQFFKDVLLLAGLADSNTPVLTEKEIHSSELQPCMKYLKEHKRRIQRWFDIDLRTDMDVKPIQQLGVILKLIGLKWKRKSKKTSDGGKEYYYWISQDHLDKLNGIVSMRSNSQYTEEWHLKRNSITENRLFDEEYDVEYQITEQIKNPSTSENG